LPDRRIQIPSQVIAFQGEQLTRGCIVADLA
jgi:hypothetical protein